MKNYTNPGLNRTGMATSPIDAKSMMEVPSMTTPPTPGRTLEDVRVEYAKAAMPMSTMPPPASIKELAKTTIRMLKGERATVLVDKLGERLAFERAGVRLYDALLTKFDAFGSWRGGPTRAELEQIRNDELSHFHVLTETIAGLGSDPTVMTPSANLHANISMGLPRVLTEPRTDLRQSLEAILVAELADNACWETLIDLSRSMGEDGLAEMAEDALATEQRHLVNVRGWIAAAIGVDATPEVGLNGGRAVSRKRPAASAKVSRRAPAKKAKTKTGAASRSKSKSKSRRN